MSKEQQRLESGQKRGLHVPYTLYGGTASKALAGVNQMRGFGVVGIRVRLATILSHARPQPCSSTPLIIEFFNPSSTGFAIHTYRLACARQAAYGWPVLDGHVPRKGS